MLNNHELAITVRKIAAMAREMIMGFSPIFVKSPGGKKFILKKYCNFFYYRWIKGENIKLLGVSYNLPEKKAEYYPVNEENLYYFYTDSTRFNTFF